MRDEDLFFPLHDIFKGFYTKNPNRRFTGLFFLDVMPICCKILSSKTVHIQGSVQVLHQHIWGGVHQIADTADNLEGVRDLSQNDDRLTL